MSSQYDGATKSTGYEKWSNQTTTDSTFDQTNLFVNTTESGTGNVTIREDTDGVQNTVDTTNDTTATENVTIFNTDVLPTEVVDSKSRSHNSFPRRKVKPKFYQKL